MAGQILVLEPFLMLGVANEREHGEVIARMNNKINGGKRKMETF